MQMGLSLTFDKDRNFPTKMYRFPMPQAELDNNGAVTQYAEWQ